MVDLSVIDKDRFIQLQNFKSVFKNGTRKNRFMLDFTKCQFAWASAIAANQDELKFLVNTTSLPGKDVKSNDREFQGMKTFFSGDYEPPTDFKCTFLSDIDGKAYNFCEAWLNAKKNNLSNTYGAKPTIEAPLVVWQTNDQGDKIAAWVLVGAVIKGLSSIDKAQSSGEFETFDASWDIELREVIRGEGTTLDAAVTAFISALTYAQ
jgi:hypothetical protein